MARQDQRYVTDLCDEVLGSPSSREHRFDWLRGDPSPRYPFGTMLPVDAYWPQLRLVLEFHERQHTDSVSLFDKLDILTVSGVPRGGPNGQRRLYDRRREALIPAHGLHLVVIPMTHFHVKRDHIERDRVQDLAVVRRHLRSFVEVGGQGV